MTRSDMVTKLNGFLLLNGRHKIENFEEYTLFSNEILTFIEKQKMLPPFWTKIGKTYYHCMGENTWEDE